MALRDMVPWNRSGSAPSVQGDETNPFLSLHREMNRLFDNAFRGLDMPMPGFGRSLWSGGSWPSLEISDNDKEVRVSAELPGLQEKDIDVSIDDDVLTLRGEKRAETEDKDRQFSERYYGRFERRIPLGTDIDEDRVQARFDNGVLTITLPKTEMAQRKAKHIPINGSATARH